MAAVIITKKDVLRLGEELLNEMLEFLHDEYILTKFKEMKEVQKKFLKNLNLNHITIHNKKVCIMKDDGNGIEGIYNSLKDLNLDMEINESLFYKTKAFLDIFRVFETGHTYL